MPNLDNIFNKFFHQSQTGSKGKFLIRMAWAVEILVAFIGLCIGIIVIRGAQGVTEASDLVSKGISLNDLTIGMIFIIVAVVAATIARAALQCTGVARQFVADACRHVADQQAAGQTIAVAADVQRVVAAVR